MLAADLYEMPKSIAELGVSGAREGKGALSLPRNAGGGSLSRRSESGFALLRVALTVPWKEREASEWWKSTAVAG